MKTIIFIFLTALTITVNTQVTEEWARRYNGPGNSEDFANSISVDGLGNVYTTGNSTGSGTGADYCTIKYNASGVQQWAARYNGPGSNYDGAKSIAVDGSGNVYVTGSSAGNGTGLDFATIKYNSSGIQQWAARYNGPGNSEDGTTSIAVDASGNVYVTGNSAGGGTDADYCTIKYNSSGLAQWIVRYNGPGNSADFAISIAIDGSGNVYVTGSSIGSGTSYDYATIKYNASGIQQWAARYNGPGNSIDFASSIAVNSSGNVYVTGGSTGSGSGLDYATIKYNSSGAQQWAVTYDYASEDDDAESLIIDASGNVYVTGGANTLFGKGFGTIKYNTSGAQQWAKFYYGPSGGEGTGRSIAMDALGNLFVTGRSLGNGTGFDYATLKYNSAGTQLWVQRYNGPESTVDEASSISIDASGNVFITGNSRGSGTGNDYCTIKYSQPTAIEPISGLVPDKFSLEQNYPNPFNPKTNIGFQIAEFGFVSLKIYDISGKEAAVLVNEVLSAGTYYIDFDAAQLASGTYFYRLQTNGFSSVKKMMLVK